MRKISRRANVPLSADMRSADELRAKRNLVGLSLDERIALSELADLDYLSGV